MLLHSLGMGDASGEEELQADGEEQVEDFLESSAEVDAGGTTAGAGKGVSAPSSGKVRSPKAKLFLKNQINQNCKRRFL